METKININKFICSLYDAMFDGSIEKTRFEQALRAQGLEVKNGELVEIEGNQGGISPKFCVGDRVEWDDSHCIILEIGEDGYHCCSTFIPFTEESNITLLGKMSLYEVSEIRNSIKKLNGKTLKYAGMALKEFEDLPIKAAMSQLRKYQENKKKELDTNILPFNKQRLMEVAKPETEEEEWTTIPFGAKDSEFISDTYYIPKECVVIIDGDTVTIKKKNL